MNDTLYEQKAIKAALNSDWEKAVEFNSKILELAEPTAAVHNRLGKAYSELGKWEDAANSFQKALKLDPLSTVAEKGLNSAKMNKKAGIKPPSTKETVLPDLSTNRIIEVNSKDLSIETDYILIPGIKNFFYLIEENSNKKIKRIGVNNLNLKPGVNPKQIKAKVIDIENDRATLKLTASSPIFTSIKQQMDPYLKQKKKKIDEEKQEIVKMYEENY